MRSFVILGLALALLTPAGAAAQETAQADTRNEAVYQGLWCLYLNARPYLTDAPEDVACEYESHAMTKDEAAAAYQRRAQDRNYVLHGWRCAEKKAKRALSWKQNRKWADKVGKAGKRQDRIARSVRWPENVRRKISKLLDYVAESDYLRRRAYNHKSYADSVSSRDWARYVNPKNRVSPTAQQVRQILGIPDVPDPGNPCKAVKRYERQQGAAAAFDSPYANEDLRRIARLLAGIGLVDSRANEAGDPSLFLTEAGLVAARAMPGISDDASAEEVVAGLFSPIQKPSPEPSSTPEEVELTFPDSEASPAP